MELQEILSHNNLMKPSTVKAVESECETIWVDKGKRIISQDAPSDRLYFILEGVVRIVREHGHIENTIAFGAEGDPCMSMHAFSTGGWSMFSVETIERTLFKSISFETFRKMLATYPDMMNWFCNELLQYAACLEWRDACLTGSSAYERYKKFIDIRSSLVNRLPLKYVAQYLNIAQATLSRFRRRHAHEK